MSKARFTDEDIIRCLQSGDPLQVEEATAYMLRKYLGVVVKLVRRPGGDPAQDVDAVLDEAVAIVVHHVQNGVYKPQKGAALSTYFYAIANNILSNILRERRHRNEILMSELPPEKPGLTLSEAEKMMNSEDMRKKVAAAFLKLDATCQQLLHKYYWEDEHIREIARWLNITEDNAKQRNHRCRENLRKLLGPDFKNWFNEK